MGGAKEDWDWSKIKESQWYVYFSYATACPGRIWEALKHQLCNMMQLNYPKQVICKAIDDSTTVSSNRTSPSEVLHRFGDTSIWVPLAQDGVYCTSQNLRLLDRWNLLIWLHPGLAVIFEANRNITALCQKRLGISSSDFDLLRLGFWFAWIASCYKHLASMLPLWGAFGGHLSWGRYPEILKYLKSVPFIFSCSVLGSAGKSGTL